MDSHPYGCMPFVSLHRLAWPLTYPCNIAYRYNFYPPILDHIPRNLSKILNLDVPPQTNTNNSNSQHRRRSNDHHLLRLTIRILDRDSRSTSNGVRQLHRQIPIDGRKVALRFGGKILHEFLGKDTSPYSSSDGRSNCAAGVGEDIFHGDDDGDVLLCCGGHYSYLFADYE